MGKIRVSTLGSEEEKESRDKRKVQREEKKKRVSSGKKEDKVHVAGLKGGQRVKSVGTSEDEIDKMIALAREVEKDQTEGIRVSDGETEEGKGKKKKKAKVRSKNYQSVVMKLEHQKVYPIADAITVLRQVSYGKFNGSVEIHINTLEKGLRGSARLPHGTGKEIRVAIATAENVEKLVEEISQGKINFDALIAHPTAVPKLAKVAKFLGPRGLMPNPKAGTISSEPEKQAEKLKKGEIAWKTETEFPIIHQVIGKLAFKDNELEENYRAFIKAVDPQKIVNITLKSTMSPGIKVQTE
ncbi:MAG: 50S ribosomal protein L1, large subunit ribosomal protein L1 [Candidatus Gottesmanbacteria bacterium GW2011_GWA2_43_14]|uniref:Ribosomal protein n=1 Tax=Candidatus Gottesmanbacteria bacterium GW2011_GWA2_43_14 TaxID=1618443 RepID=A0A0G1FL27_9BACT|nr:MAG: 50S ribosomal protein L1, large subunit ribosomal protein L1 [Candidatus Gottesmanbacteria bacterium GW2011_GWA2_43_14]